MNHKSYSEEQIAAAWRALNTSIDTVKSHFANQEIKQIDNYSIKATILEIRFENATLNCLFDQNKICDTVYLFFDNQNDIYEYITYCNQTYRYDNESYSWLNNNCYIWFYIENEVINIVFSSAKPLSNCQVI